MARFFPDFWRSLVGLLLFTSPAFGVDAGVDLEVSGVTVGLEGMWKVGHWTDVTVQLQSTAGFSGTVEIEAPDGEAAPVRYASDEVVTVAPNSSVTITRLTKIGRRDRPLTVLAAHEGETLLRHQISLADKRGLDSQQGVVLQLGSSPTLEAKSTQRKLRNLLVHPLTAEAFPQSWESLTSVQAIWISSSDGTVNELSSAQQRAIAQWTHLGGHLVLLGARNAESLLTDDRIWSNLVPGRLISTASRRFGGSIEQFAGAQERLPEFLMAGVEPQGENTTVLASVTGADTTVAGIIRAPKGFGLVTFAGLDLELEPFTNWDSASELTLRLLELPGQRDMGEQRSVGTVRHVGYDDLSGQVRSALDEFTPIEGVPGVGVVAFSLVILVLVAYVGLVGPGDYYLLRRLKRFEWTWITFPLWVIALSSAIVIYRGRLKSDVMLLNQADVVDVDVASGYIRGTHWSQLYTPTTSQRTVIASASPGLTTLPVAGQSAQLLLGWQGLPGRALGAMESTASAGLLSQGYTIDARQQRIVGLPLRNASSRSLAAQWWDQREFSSTSELHDEDGVLRGRVTLPLSVDLEDCVLFYGTWAHLFDGGELNAGETVTISDLLRRDLDWRLTQKRIAQQSDTSYTTTPWDAGDRDLTRVMEIVMFHNAAGGQQYTRLRHDYQGFLDLTTHLNMGRAVLMGRTRPVATRITVDDDRPPGQRWSFYRVVYPVENNKN